MRRPKKRQIKDKPSSWKAAVSGVSAAQETARKMLEKLDPEAPELKRKN